VAPLLVGSLEDSMRSRFLGNLGYLGLAGPVGSIARRLLSPVRPYDGSGAPSAMRLAVNPAATLLLITSGLGRMSGGHVTWQSRGASFSSGDMAPSRGWRAITRR
jgi:hypothetical protein